MRQKLYRLIIPLFVSVLIFIFGGPVLAQTLTQEQTLQQSLINGDVVVDSEIGNNGFRQVYYIFDGSKRFVTDSNYTNADPVIGGEYITWMSQINGVWQIFLYHIPTDDTIQITLTGNNVNPKISEGRVVWEGWIDGGWQVFFFDGKSVRQLTSGDISMNPEIEGDNIIYGRKDVTETWRAVVYSISRNETQDITTGIAAKHPALENGKIILGRVGGKGGEEFPLTVDDLFLLDLVPLTVEDEIVPETVTEEEIIEELEATPSAEIIDTATPSGEIQ
jgi:beta propeller repeat protein